MKNVFKFVVLGDLHLRRTDPLGIVAENGHNTRLDDKLTVLKNTVAHAIKVCATHFVLEGDVFESINPPETLRKLFWETVNPLIEKGIQIRIIIGNHDSTGLSYNFSGENVIVSNNIKIISKPFKEKLQINEDDKDSIEVLYVPYTKHTKEIVSVLKESTADFVFGHFEIEGAQLAPDNPKIRHGIKKELLKKFKLVWLGHIHTFQEFWKNCGYLGGIVICDFGELGADKFFGQINICGKEIETEYIEIPQRKMYQITISENDPSNLYLSENIPKELKERGVLLKFIFEGSEAWVRSINKHKFKKLFPNAIRVLIDEKKLDTDRNVDETPESYTMIDLVHLHVKQKNKDKDHLEVGKELAKMAEGLEI